jgi:hypothetical protein
LIEEIKERKEGRLAPKKMVLGFPAKPFYNQRRKKKRGNWNCIKKLWRGE